MLAKSLQSCLFVTLWTVALQAPLSMGFSRQEYWSGLPFPTLVDLPNPGIEPMSLVSPVLAVRFFTTSATWEDSINIVITFIDSHIIKQQYIPLKNSTWSWYNHFIWCLLCSANIVLMFMCQYS